LDPLEPDIPKPPYDPFPVFLFPDLPDNYSEEGPVNQYPHFTPWRTPQTSHSQKPKAIAFYWEFWGETICANHTWRCTNNLEYEPCGLVEGVTIVNSVLTCTGNNDWQVRWAASEGDNEKLYVGNGEGEISHIAFKMLSATGDAWLNLYSYASNKRQTFQLGPLTYPGGYPCENAYPSVGSIYLFDLRTSDLNNDEISLIGIQCWNGSYQASLELDYINFYAAS